MSHYFRDPPSVHSTYSNSRLTVETLPSVESSPTASSLDCDFQLNGTLGRCSPRRLRASSGCIRHLSAHLPTPCSVCRVRRHFLYAVFPSFLPAGPDLHGSLIAEPASPNPLQLPLIFVHVILSWSRLKTVTNILTPAQFWLLDLKKVIQSGAQQCVLCPALWVVLWHAGL